MAAPSFIAQLTAREEPAVARSFTFQYTSLILIVLAFTVGSLAMPPSKQAAQQDAKPEIKHEQSLSVPPVEAPKFSPLQPLSLAPITFTPRFMANGRFVGDELSQAITFVLSQHDVNAEIVLQADSMHLGRRTEEALEIYRYFLSQGVRPNVLQVLATEGQEGNPARCIFSKEPQV